MKYKVPNFVEMVDLARCSTFFIFLQFAWNFLVKRSKHVWSIDFRNHFLTPNIILLPCNTTFLSTTHITYFEMKIELYIDYSPKNQLSMIQISYQWEMRRKSLNCLRSWHENFIQYYSSVSASWMLLHSAQWSDLILIRFEKRNHSSILGKNLKKDHFRVQIKLVII